MPKENAALKRMARQLAAHDGTNYTTALRKLRETAAAEGITHSAALEKLTGGGQEEIPGTADGTGDLSG